MVPGEGAAKIAKRSPQPPVVAGGGESAAVARAAHGPDLNQAIGGRPSPVPEDGVPVMRVRRATEEDADVRDVSVMRVRQELAAGGDRAVEAGLVVVVVVALAVVVVALAARARGVVLGHAYRRVAARRDRGRASSGWA